MGGRSIGEVGEGSGVVPQREGALQSDGRLSDSHGEAQSIATGEVGDDRRNRAPERECTGRSKSCAGDRGDRTLPLAFTRRIVDEERFSTRPLALGCEGCHADPQLGRAHLRPATDRRRRRPRICRMTVIPDREQCPVMWIGVAHGESLPRTGPEKLGEPQTGYAPQLQPAYRHPAYRSTYLWGLPNSQLDGLSAHRAPSPGWKLTHVLRSGSRSGWVRRTVITTRRKGRLPSQIGGDA